MWQCAAVAASAERGSRTVDERPWVIAVRAALAIVAVLIVVLVVTGIMLVFQYHPTVLRVFGTPGVALHEPRARTIHRLAARLMYPALGAVAIAAAGLALVRRRYARVAVPIVAGVALLAASISGYVLPWDQLSLRYVTLGSSTNGYRMILFHDNVKYVLLGDREVGSGTIARWFWLHSVGITLVLVALLVVIAFQSRPRDSEST